MVHICTITVSDTRTAETDESGKLLRERLSAAGFELGRHVLVRDEPDEVKALLLDITGASGVEAVVLTGGTGIAPRDRTYEVVEALFNKRLDGFGEAFRRLSWDAIGPRSILSRATAGTIGKVVVFSLPGSPGAVKLAVDDVIAKVLKHAVGLASGKQGKHDKHT
jgi:molybdenum cofactor biosynthesis protein B